MLAVIKSLNAQLLKPENAQGLGRLIVRYVFCIKDQS